MDNELLIRLGVFFGILVVMFLWELIAPRRPLTTSKITRWFSNLGFVLIDSIVVRLVFSNSIGRDYPPRPAKGVGFI
jgi:hypothetical protein